MTSSALWSITAMKHTNTVTRYPGTASELANEIGDLYYDALANHLHLLAQKMASDSAADASRGRGKLAAELLACSQHLAQAAQHIATAWRICEPFVDPVRKAAKP